MAKIRKVFILANGTISVSQNSSSQTGYFGFFSLRQFAKWWMTNPSNFINQLAEHCHEEHVLILDGPGSDLINNSGSILKSVSALVDGHIGDNGISANLEKIRQFLQRQYQEAVEAQESLFVCGVGWSRGGLLLTQMRQWIEQESRRGAIKVSSTHLHLIDTVAGGPSDRLRYFFNNPHDSNPIPMNIAVHNYYSNSGNLNLWDYLIQYLPKNYQLNTPFFSAVIDGTKNTRFSIDDEEYTHSSTNWLFPATHEALVGKPSNQLEQLSGDIVLADIVRHLTTNSINMDETWAKKVIAKGQLSLEELRQSKIAWVNNRKYLDFQQRETIIFGRDLIEEDNMNTFLTIKDFNA